MVYVCEISTSKIQGNRHENHAFETVYICRLVSLATNWLIAWNFVHELHASNNTCFMFCLQWCEWIFSATAHCYQWKAKPCQTYMYGKHTERVKVCSNSAMPIVLGRIEGCVTHTQGALYTAEQLCTEPCNVNRHNRAPTRQHGGTYRYNFDI